MKTKAFSLVELIIVISIMVLLAIISFTYSESLLSKRNNSKVVADISTIDASLMSYKAEESSVLLPQGNLNYFSKSGTYVHTGSEAYGVYGQFTENSLAKKYLDLVPLDPRTNQYYSYGAKLEDGQYEIAGVIQQEKGYIARLTSTYNGVGGINSLIREYNGPNFIRDGYGRLPYNPEDRKLVATDEYGNIYTVGDIITIPASDEDQKLEIYFSDGSVSILEGQNASLTLTEMSFPKGNNLVSSIKLFLTAGSIWTQATHLDSDSNFEIYTQDTTASVRGTIFRVTKESNSTIVVVYAGEVEVNGVPVRASDGEADMSEVPDFRLPDYTETPINIIDDDLVAVNGDCYDTNGNFLLGNGDANLMYNEYCNSIVQGCQDGELLYPEYTKLESCDGTTEDEPISSCDDGMHNHNNQCYTKHTLPEGQQAKEYHNFYSFYIGISKEAGFGSSNTTYCLYFDKEYKIDFTSLYIQDYVLDKDYTKNLDNGKYICFAKNMAGKKLIIIEEENKLIIED